MNMVHVKLLMLVGALVVIRLLLTYASSPEKGKSRILDLVDTGIIACLVTFLLVAYVFQLSRVDGDSMLPSLHNGDFTIVNKLIYRLHPPQRGDIIVFEAPNEEGADYIKRVVALPGETVSIEHGWVIVKGFKLNEPYVLNQPERAYSEITVPEDHLFVLGDNRQNSQDSRTFDALPKKNILGKASFIIWPPSRWGFIQSFRGKRFLGRDAGL